MKFNTNHMLDAFRQCGLDTEDHIIEDGQLHRIHILGDKSGSKNGWYTASSTGGAFGSWKEGITHIWRSGQNLTVTQRRQMDDVFHAMRIRAEQAKQEQYARNLKHIRDAWAQSVPITDDAACIARIYLHNRLGDELDTLPDNIRFHPNMYCKESHPRPVMLSVISDPSGKPCGLHRTYLSEDGTKADIPSAKKIMGAHKDNALRGGAIRLYEPTHELIVAEGIETALAIYHATGKPVWSAISAHGLSSVVM